MRPASVSVQMGTFGNLGGRSIELVGSFTAVFLIRDMRLVACMYHRRWRIDWCRKMPGEIPSQKTDLQENQTPECVMMGTMKLRVGVIGLGGAWETRHRPALRALGDRYEVRAICEQVGHKAEAAAKEFDACAVDGYRALAARDDIDAILILSPQWYGPLPILAACDEGKAVYCGAAMELEAEQARVIRDRVEQAGIAFMAEFPRRHAPATLRLKELIATRLGPPRLLFCHQRKLAKAPTPQTANKNSQRHGVQPSTITRELIELVDWCRYVVGHEPNSVFGVVGHLSSTSPRPDYEHLNLDFSVPQEPEKTATAQISCGVHPEELWHEAVAFRRPPGLQVCCENGVAFVDLPSNLVWFDVAGRHEESLKFERPVGEQLLSQFHRSVTSLIRRTGGIEDAYRALNVVITARQARHAGQRFVLCDD